LRVAAVSEGKRDKYRDYVHVDNQGKLLKALRQDKDIEEVVVDIQLPGSLSLQSISEYIEKNHPDVVVTLDMGRGNNIEAGKDRYRLGDIASVVLGAISASLTSVIIGIETIALKILLGSLVGALIGSLGIVIVGKLADGQEVGR
jgi:hypothetical protein